MGAQREDTDPNPKRGGTEPGLGAVSGQAPAAPGPANAPVAVDFDALHAALGDPLELDELSAPVTEANGDRSEELPDGLDERGDSSGRTNAQYASTRPHTIPPSYTPNEDPNAPAVIVASEDTVPSAPPQMTVRVAHPRGIAHTPQSGVPFVAPAPAGHPNSGPQASAPTHSPSYPHTPPSFRAQPRNPAQMTMRMPERPINPRRNKTPTLVVRPRGPSAKQKLLAFLTMLLLVTACGIAVIIWRKPRWLGLDPGVPLHATTLATTLATTPELPGTTPAVATAPLPAAPASPSVSTATATGTASTAPAAAPASASAPPPVRFRPRPLPPPTAQTSAPPHPSAPR